jgi:uncharacterized protein
MVDQMIYLFLLIGGLLAGTIGSLAGLGGGIVIVPLLLGLDSLLPISITQQVAVGTSMLAIVVTSFSSSIAYCKHKRVDFKSGFIFFIGSGPGGILGSWANQFFNNDSFTLYFGIFMIAISILLMIKPNEKAPVSWTSGKIFREFTASNGETFSYSFPLSLALVIAFIVGFMSGFLGIGGGSLLVPAMIVLFTFPPHIAVATSMLVVCLSAIVSSITHITLGNINWLYVLLLVPGAWVGGKLGVYINEKLSSKSLVAILRLILIIVGIRMIL